MNLTSDRLREAAWALVPATVRVDRAVENTRRFLTEGRILSGTAQGAVDYADGAMWLATSDRSDARRLHGFLFAADWHVAVAALTQHERTLLADRTAAVVMEWHRRFDEAALAPEMAYHDETTAQRLLMLTALTETVLRGHVARDAVRELADSTADLLLSDGFHAGSNNHGMFQDIALLAFASLCRELPDERAVRLAGVALQRLDDYARASFTAEGVHIEHAPTYHLMVLRQLATVADVADALGAVRVTDHLRSLVAGGERYAMHALTPRGVFPPVSDTEQKPVRSPAILGVLRSSEFRFAATRGREGSVPEERAVAFPQSGYGIFRSSWTDAQAAYCFFAAAYHGGYHKHADELSLHLEARGVEILREAGPYGYNYSDPFTQYGFSSFAHNTLVVDGTGLPRHDGRFDETWLEDRGTTPEHLDVLGVTTRYDGVRWERRVTAEGDDADSTVVRVHDVVTADRERRFTFLWHLGPRIAAVVHTDQVELFVGDGKVAELALATSAALEVTAATARATPPLAGWTFPAMGERVPTTTLAVTVNGASADLITTIRTGGFLLRDRGVRPMGPWRSRPGPTPLNYLLDLPEERPRGLVVAFSAIGQPYDFTYNYRSTLDGLPLARLFVLDDFGDQGAYYHSRRRDHGPFLAVQELIQEVLVSLGLTAEALYTAGSSKGGTAALLHGLAAKAAHVVVGAPQTRIGTFLRTAHPNVLEYMAGGTREEDVAWADGIVDRMLQVADGPTSVTVLVGRDDHHLRGHVEPLLETPHGERVTVDALVVPGTPHSAVGAVYRQYLRSHIEWTLGSAVVPHCLLVARGSTLHLALGGFDGVDGVDGASTSTKVYRGSDLIASTPYAVKSSYTWDDLGPGTYRVRVYVRQQPRAGDVGGPPSAFTTSRVTIPA